MGDLILWDLRKLDVLSFVFVHSLRLWTDIWHLRIDKCRCGFALRLEFVACVLPGVVQDVLNAFKHK